MSNYLETLRHRQISRRTMLGASAKAGVGAAGLALVGCGDDDDDAGTAAAERAASAAEEAAAAAVAAGEARAAETEAAADAAAEAAAAASEASAAASQAADAADAAAALAAEAAESEDAANAAAAAEAAAAAAADAAAAASAAGDEAAAAVAAAASEAAEAAAQAARDAAAAVEAGTATAEAAQAAIDEAAAAAAAAAEAAGEASAAAGEAAATAQETAEAAAETAAAAVAAAEEAADAAREAAESAAMAGEDEPAAAGGPQRGGTVALTRWESIHGGFNPYISLSAADHYGYLSHLYDSVLGFDKAGRIAPELAESWELPDDLTYIFNMRPGCLFQDGAACDAHALQANMDYLTNTEDLAGQDRARAGISKAVSREVIDDLSWRMVNSEPFAPTVVNFLASPGTGMLISPAHFETAITNPVGAGPMFQTDYNDGENWVAERWDGYWDNDNVWVDGMEQLILPDANSGWNAFLSGEVSYSRPPGGMTRAVQDQLIADGFQALSGTNQIWMQSWFNLNPDRPPEINLFRDPRLRRAVHLSIDREAINQIATEGLGKASRAPVSQESWALLPDKDYYADSPNVAEAHQLMDAAGYGDGITGTYLSFATEFHRRMAEPVHNQLREAGFDFQFVEDAQAVILDRVWATEDWQMAVFTWESPFDPDPVPRNTMTGFMNWMYGSPEGGPRTGRADPALHPNDEVLQALAETDQLVNAAAVGPSQEDRISHYDALFQNSTDNGWDYHIAQYNQGWAGQGNLENFEFRDVDGWIVGDGAKYLWFST